MARTTKAELEAQIAELLLTVGALRSRVIDLENTLSEKNLKAEAAAHADMRAAQAAPAPAPAPKLALVQPAPSAKAAAQAAAKAAAMSSKRCTRVVQLPSGDWGFEFYGRKAA